MTYNVSSGTLSLYSFTLADKQCQGVYDFENIVLLLKFSFVSLENFIQRNDIQRELIFYWYRP